MKKWIPISIGVLLLVLVIYYFACEFTYSQGYRAGLLFKFSQKGYVFKTYEGELNLGGVNTDPKAGLVNSIWPFSVKDRAVADQLMQMEGKYVRIHYRQIVKHFVWEGETDYFVDSASVVN